MPRGEDCGLHPRNIMMKKTSPCGRKDKHVEVEDHGNGFMFVGTSDIKQARRILVEYTDDHEAYEYAARVWDKERRACCVWLTDTALAVWDGATDYQGRALKR